MSWQDELRRLDDELAAGRISADDYRSRRDQILSTAVSPGAAPNQAPNQTPEPGSTESTTMMPPIQGPSQGQSQNQRPEGGDADKTQIVSGQDVGESDRTQSVGGWRAAPPEDPNRTQVVPGVPPQAHAGARPPRPAPPPQGSPPGGFPQPNQPPWQNEEDLAPPWAGQEFPPLAAAGTPDWTRQGPEVFETERKSGAGKVLGIVAIVVVLLGLAAGAYFMFRPDDTQADDGNNGGNPNNPPASSEPASSTKEEPQGPIVELPGEAANMSHVTTFADVEKIDYLTKQEIALYKQGDANAATVAISTENGVRIIVLVVTMADEQAAVTAADALGALQLRFTLSEAEGPEGVQVAANEAAEKGPLLRAHYSSGDQVIRIQAQGLDADESHRLFDETIDAQLERLPAND